MELEREVNTSALTQRGVSNHEAHGAGVSWSAVIAGGFVTAAIGLIMLSLGAGLGLSVDTGSSTAIKASAIIWLIFLEITSSSLGGYLAGRLRGRWTVIHGDEVYFRDTAHGFLSWSVALVVTAAFLGSAATSISGSHDAPPSVMNGTSTSGDSGSTAYFVDQLFRSDGGKISPESTFARGEVDTIFSTSLLHGDLTASDKAYVAQLVTTMAGVDHGVAEQRVSNVFSNAQQAAQSTRKAVAHTLLWTFIALLIGAFCASFAGTIGGRQRDHVKLI